MQVIIRALASLPLGLPASQAISQSAPPAFKETQALIEEGIRSGRVPSVAVAVVKDDRLLWSAGYGLADIESKRPATADSVYLLASVSKPLAATGLMLLVD